MSISRESKTAVTFPPPFGYFSGKTKSFFSTPAPTSDADKLNFHIRRMESDLEKLKTISDPTGEQKQIDTIADNFSDSAQIIHNIGFLIGGKSGGKIMQVGSGLAQIGTSIAAFQSGATTLCMAGGVTGIAVGAFVIAMALFAEEEDGISAHQQIMEALYGLAQMIEKGFNMVLEKQEFTLLQISQLSSQINRVEKLIGVTAKESYLKDYLTLTIRLKNYLNDRGVKPSDTEMSKDLGDLQSWIAFDGHAYKATVTGSMLIADCFDPSYHVGILGHREFDNASMIAYMASLLEQFVPHCLTDPMKIKLPNLRILVEATMLYKNIIEKLHPPGNVAPIFAEISQQWKNVADYVNALSVNSALWDSLCIQVNAYARQAHRYLAFLESINKFTSTEGPISAILPEGIERTKLIEILNHLEIRRLLMGKFCEILANPPALLERMTALPSKAKILTKLRSSLQEANKQLYAAGTKGNVEGVREALEAGANPNTIIRYTTALYGEAKAEFAKRKHSLEILDLLTRYSVNDSLNTTMRTVILDYPSQWNNYTPLDVMIAHGCFEQVILMCAQGFDTSESISQKHGMRFKYDFGPTAFNVGGIKWNLQLAIVRDINNPKGILNKEDLRNAYAFYRAAQDDNQTDITRFLAEKKVKPHVMIWLTALFGDVKPLQELKARGVVISPEDATKGIDYGDNIFYPLQLAVLLGRANVIRVIEGHANYTYSNALVERVSGKEAVVFAEEQGFYDTAYELLLSGFNFSKERYERITLQPEYYKQRTPLTLSTYPEEKKSLGLYSASLSRSFALAKRETIAASVDSPKFIKMITDEKYADAAQHIVKISMLRQISEERADTYLRGFARLDFSGVVLAKINSKVVLINEMLRKNMGAVINSYAAKKINLDAIELAKAISAELAIVTTPLTDESTIELIKRAAKKSLEIHLHLLPNLETYIKTGLWETIALDFKGLNKANQKKLLPYLIESYLAAKEDVEEFSNLLFDFQKNIGMDADIDRKEVGETKRSAPAVSEGKEEKKEYKEEKRTTKTATSNTSTSSKDDGISFYSRRI